MNENFVVHGVGQASSSGRVRCEGTKEDIGRKLAKICQTTAGLELNGHKVRQRHQEKNNG